MNSNTTARIVASIASVLITAVLLNSVTIGMTTTAPVSASMTCATSAPVD